MTTNHKKPYDVEWILCPICDSKTRDRIREDTVFKNYPLYCQKRKRETLSETQLYKQAGNAVTATAWEDFGGSVQEMGQKDFSGSIRDTAWEDFCDSVEEMESRNFNDYSVSGTARDDFGSIEKEEMAGEVLGDSGAEPGEDFDFLDGA